MNRDTRGTGRLSNLLSWEDTHDPSRTYSRGRPHVMGGRINDANSDHANRPKKKKYNRVVDKSGFDGIPPAFASVHSRLARHPKTPPKTKVDTKKDFDELQSMPTRRRIFGDGEPGTHGSRSRRSSDRAEVMKRTLYNRKHRGEATSKYLIERSVRSPTQRYEEPLTTTMEMQFQIEEGIRKNPSPKKSQFGRKCFKKVDDTLY